MAQDGCRTQGNTFCDLEDGGVDGSFASQMCRTCCTRVLMASLRTKTNSCRGSWRGQRTRSRTSWSLFPWTSAGSTRRSRTSASNKTESTVCHGCGHLKREYPTHQRNEKANRKGGYEKGKGKRDHGCLQMRQRQRQGLEKAHGGRVRG